MKDSNNLFKFNIEKIKSNPLELKRVLRAIKFVRQYKVDSLYQTNKYKYDYDSLDEKYKKKLNFNYEERIKQIIEGFDFNQKYLDILVNYYHPYFKNDQIEDEVNRETTNPEYTNTSCFWYLVRDWTKEGKEERAISYGRIIKEALKYYNKEEDFKRGIKVLCPGAGLCRLAYELAKENFKVEANDFSYFNVFSNDYLFNHFEKIDQFTFQPLIYSFANSFSNEHCFKKYSFPDEDIKENLNNAKYHELVMNPGDFIENYQNRNNEFDCVTTCFFIDTARNIIQYVEIIYNLLKKGGVWINLGPLDYHFTYNEQYSSIDLPWSDLRDVIINYGFEIKNEEHQVIPYCKIEGYMKNSYYDSLFFTCLKK